MKNQLRKNQVKIQNISIKIYKVKVTYIIEFCEF